jgi:pyruvate-ferredoxin/flavodoxin oxidoreductase
MIKSAEDRRSFWMRLRDLALTEEAPVADEVQIESRIRQEVVSKIASGLAGLISGDQALDMDALLEGAPAPPRPVSETAAASSSDAASRASVAEAIPSAAAPEVSGEYMAPWIDTSECTTCDECIMINSQIFEYNAEEKAIIKNAEGGPYRDLVKAAEKCTAEVIHPGLPRDRSAKDIAKWIKRGQRFN